MTGVKLFTRNHGVTFDRMQNPHVHPHLGYRPSSSSHAPEIMTCSPSLQLLLTSVSPLLLFTSGRTPFPHPPRSCLFLDWHTGRPPLRRCPWSSASELERIDDLRISRSKRMGGAPEGRRDKGRGIAHSWRCSTISGRIIVTLRPQNYHLRLLGV